MSKHIPWWLWPNLLCLDAPAVAMLWQRFMADALGLNLAIAPTVCLGLVVWGVYLLDRGLDNRPSRPVDPAARHQFARAHCATMTYAGAAVLLMGAGLALVTLMLPIIVGGLSLGMGLAGYLIAVHFYPLIKRGTKEFVVAAIFACGVVLPVITAIPDRVGQWFPTLIGFQGVCWLNCVFIDRWEAGRRGWNATTTLATMIALSGAGFSPIQVGGAILASTVLLWILHFGHPRIGLQATRVLADVVLLTPLALGFR